MKKETQPKDYNGFATFSELLAWLKRTPPHIVMLISEGQRFKN